MGCTSLLQLLINSAFTLHWMVFGKTSISWASGSGDGGCKEDSWQALGLVCGWQLLGTVLQHSELTHVITAAEALVLV